MSTSLRSAARGLRQASFALAARAVLALGGAAIVLSLARHHPVEHVPWFVPVLAAGATLPSVAFAVGLLRAARLGRLAAVAAVLVTAATALECIQAAVVYRRWVHDGHAMGLGVATLIGPITTELGVVLLLLAIATSRTELGPLRADATVPLGVLGLVAAAACTWWHGTEVASFAHWWVSPGRLTAIIVAHLVLLAALVPACRAAARWLDDAADEAPTTAIASP
jgi:hypothetical protein